MTPPDKLIKLTFSVKDGLHRFASADGSIVVERRDPRRAVRRVVEAILKLPDGPFYCQLVDEQPPLPLRARLEFGGGVLYTPPSDKTFIYKRVRFTPAIAHADLPPPVYASWRDYLERTTYGERMIRCHAAAKRANRRHANRDGTRLTGMDIWAVIEGAQGRCLYCRSLAVERCPTGGWGHMGRRIGSLEHKEPLLGRSNEVANLAWACMWCNTHPGERIAFSEDYGGHYPLE